MVVSDNRLGIKNLILKYNQKSSCEHLSYSRDLTLTLGRVQSRDPIVFSALHIVFYDCIKVCSHKVQASV